jgi:hypothetical protein
MSAVPDGFHDNAALQVPSRLVLLFNALGVGAVTLAVLMAPCVAVYWLTVDPDAVRALMRLGGDVLPDITMGQRLAAAVIGILTVLPMAWGLPRLRNWLNSAAVGRPFSINGIAALRDVAKASLLSAVTLFVSHTPMGLVLTWNAMDGHRQISVSLDSHTLMLALFAGTAAAAAWAMSKAAELAEENSQFV